MADWPSANRPRAARGRRPRTEGSGARRRRSEPRPPRRRPGGPAPPTRPRTELKEKIPVDEKDMGPDLERVLLSQSELEEGVTRLATEIDAQYSGRELLLVGVLKGALMVMADLSRAL